jgi:hypothetical protein
MGRVGSYRPGMDSTMTPDLTTPEANRQAAGSRHARWRAPVLAVAAVAAVTGITLGVTAITTSSKGSATKPNSPVGRVNTSPSTSAPSTPAPSTPAPSTSAAGATAPAPRPSAAASPSGASHAVPALLRNDAQQSREQIPWSQVGPGWFLAAPYNATSGTGKGLYLINPIGGRYLITDHLPHARDGAVAWSPDGTRAMLTRRQNNENAVFTEVELATGRVLHTFNASDTSFIGYTRPQGHAILVIRDAGTSPSLERLSTDGSHQLTYPRTLPGFGEIGFPVLYNATGTELLVGGQHGMALLGNDGRLIRILRAPAGAHGCWPTKWWNSSTVLETCNFDVSPRYSVLLQPVAGGQSEKLAGAGKTYPLGFADAWRYSEGTLLSEGTGCGPGRLDVLRDGVIRTLKLPAGVEKYPPVIGVNGDLVTLRRLGGCPIRNEESVISLNLVTGATTTLFRGTAQLIPYPWQ